MKTFTLGLICLLTKLTLTYSKEGKNQDFPGQGDLVRTKLYTLQRKITEFRLSVMYCHNTKYEIKNHYSYEKFFKCVLQSREKLVNRNRLIDGPDLELAERDFEITLNYLKYLQEKIYMIGEKRGNFRRYMAFVENLIKKRTKWKYQN